MRDRRKKPWMIVLTFRVYKQDQEGDAQDVQNSQLSHVLCANQQTECDIHQR